MQWTGKLVGGALGMALGPVGAVLGVAVGHQYDLMHARRARSGAEQFFVSTFRLMGHVAKADGAVTPREIEAARQVMRGLALDGVQVQMAIAEFTRGKQPDFDMDAEMQDLRRACRAQPEIMRVFVENQLRFALAGSDLAGVPRQRLSRAAALLGISPALFERMETGVRGGGRPATAAGHAARVAAAYQALEADPAITNEELTRHYRRLMSRHHPDKLKANGLPDSMLEAAKQRTQEIREAYELLRGQRGMG